MRLEPDLDALADRLAELKPEGGTSFDAVLSWALANADGATGCGLHKAGAGVQEVPRAEPPRRTSWAPQDLTNILDGTYEPPMPAVGQRSDGPGLFYPGRIHSVAGETEAGKSWLALDAVAIELRAGRAAIYLDFEDTRGGIIGRLLAMGHRVMPSATASPTSSPTRPSRHSGATPISAKHSATCDLRPVLVVSTA